MRNLSLLVGLVVCIGLATAIAVNASTNSENNDIVLSPSGMFIGAHAKDITFYNSNAKNCWFRISGADWIYSNGTIMFKRTSDIKITTQRDLKGTVWICTKRGWNPLGDQSEYYKDRGYCYITSLRYGEAKIPAAKLIPGEEYVIIVGVTYYSSYILTDSKITWIKTDDTDTFDRVEIFGYGPIPKVPFKIVVEEE
ncbi:hypothetical protein [Archaeoglobus sp.]